MHAGIVKEDIKHKVQEACELAKKNRQQCSHIDTVLFLDEANTTEAIGLVKEIMCDHSMEGQPLQAIEGLKIIAACNPYRKYVLFLHVYCFIILKTPQGTHSFYSHIGKKLFEETSLTVFKMTCYIYIKIKCILFFIKLQFLML